MSLLFILVRAVTYATLFIELVLGFLPARVLDGARGSSDLYARRPSPSASAADTKPEARSSASIDQASAPA